MFCLSVTNPSFIALLRDTRVRSCKHSSRQLAWCETLSAEDAGGTLQNRGLLLRTLLSTSFLAAAALGSVQSTQSCLPPGSFTDTLAVFLGSSAQFQQMQYSAFSEFSTSGFPWYFPCKLGFVWARWGSQQVLLLPRLLSQPVLKVPQWAVCLESSTAPQKAVSWNVLWAGHFFVYQPQLVAPPTYITIQTTATATPVVRSRSHSWGWRYRL